MTNTSKSTDKNCIPLSHHFHSFLREMGKILQHMGRSIHNGQRSKVSTLTRSESTCLRRRMVLRQFPSCEHQQQMLSRALLPGNREKVVEVSEFEEIGHQCGLPFYIPDPDAEGGRW